MYLQQLTNLANNYGYCVKLSNSHSFINFNTKTIRVKRGSDVVANLTHEVVHLLQHERGMLTRVPALYRKEALAVRDMVELAYSPNEIESEVVAFTMQNYPEVILSLSK